MSVLTREMNRRAEMRETAAVMNARVAKRKGTPVEIHQWANWETMVHYGPNGWCVVPLDVWNTL